MNELNFEISFDITPLLASDSGAQYQEGGGNLPGYQEDFFQRIVNVSWAKGLAVEFFDGAS